MICHREAYEYSAVSCFCNPSAYSEKKTRSSANDRYIASVRNFVHFSAFLIIKKLSLMLTLYAL